MRKGEACTDYIDVRNSIRYSVGDDSEAVLRTIAGRYMGQNPARPFVFSAFHGDGFIHQNDGRLNMNLSEKFPDAKKGQTAYAAAMLWMDQEEEKEFQVNCYGPVRIFVNTELVFRSAVREDVNVRMEKTFRVSLKKGWNTFLVRFIQTASGFGCLFTPVEIRWNPLTFTGPFQERRDTLGFAYSEPCRDEDDDLPPAWGLQGTEAETGLRWYPERQWKSEERNLPPLERIFRRPCGKYVLAWTSFVRRKREDGRIQITVRTDSGLRLWLDGKQIIRSEGKAGEIISETAAGAGKHQLLLAVRCMETERFFADVSLMEGGERISFEQPYVIKGSGQPWFYSGPFDGWEETDRICPEDVQTMTHLLGTGEQQTFWRLDEPYTWIRPSLQSELFGRWNYPLGVTLYGLLQTGRSLGREDMTEYAVSHISMCADIQEYAMWDMKQYGYPELNNQICTMGMLDDCGSFASAMLEAMKDVADGNIRNRIRSLAEQVAMHMEERQERRPDGAFYRLCRGHFMENTLWADDLYMSTPFLIRFYQLTGDDRYLKDAASQFLLFRNYLFSQEKKLMSHVYDFKYQTPTFVFWGRGNGWVLFSLSELLAVLPETHRDYGKLLEFFRELCSGCLACQGSNGMWHQVLDEYDSYEETSCTAMFIYGFSRGIRYGWIDDRDGRYLHAARKAWKALTEKAIDSGGNVYGVCRGSHYSFTSGYYKKELLPRINDTHGIGIVLLAGVELRNLEPANLPEKMCSEI